MGAHFLCFDCALTGRGREEEGKKKVYIHIHRATDITINKKILN